MKLIIYMETHKIGSRYEKVVEVDDEELADMSEQEQHDYFNEIVEERKAELGDWGWEIEGQ